VIYLWGEEDSTVGRGAAAGTAEFVTAPYTLETVPGVGHFITDQAPEIVTARLFAHLREQPAGARRPADARAGDEAPR
jgi:pimeloyl-ACP methyl ester carboxylesterase